MTIKIRPAHLNDINWLISQVQQFSEFFGTRKRLFDNEEFARQGLTATIENHVMFIAEGEGIGPMGFIAGIVIPHMFNPNIRVLAETFWWVDEKHRGTRAGLMLLNKFVEHGKSDADWVLMSLESDSPVNDKCLLKRGFNLKERSYLLEVS